MAGSGREADTQVRRGHDAPAVLARHERRHASGNCSRRRDRWRGASGLKGHAEAREGERRTIGEARRLHAEDVARQEILEKLAGAGGGRQREIFLFRGAIRLFGGCDLATEFTGLFAAEGVLGTLEQAIVLRIADEHPGPCVNLHEGIRTAREVQAAEGNQQDLEKLLQGERPCSKRKDEGRGRERVTGRQGQSAEASFLADGAKGKPPRFY